MQTHQLKTWPEHYQAVIDGSKTAELRKDDRGFAVGDLLVLREWEPSTSEYTGRAVMVRVTHRLAGPWLADGYVMLSLHWARYPVDDNLSGAATDPR